MFRLSFGKVFSLLWKNNILPWLTSPRTMPKWIPNFRHFYILKLVFLQILKKTSWVPSNVQVSGSSELFWKCENPSRSNAMVNSGHHAWHGKAPMLSFLEPVCKKVAHFCCFCGLMTSCTNNSDPNISCILYLSRLLKIQQQRLKRWKQELAVQVMWAQST